MAKIKVYQCQHSGLFLPGDYIENWGKWYGRGLGIKPVSECLNTNYGSFDPRQVMLVNTQVPPEQWMLPVGETYADISLEYVTEEQMEAPLEQWVNQEAFEAVENNPDQFRLVKRRIAVTPDHPAYIRGNRMICRCDDVKRKRIDVAIRKNQKEHPEWAALQALIGGLTYGSEERKVWA